MQNEDRLSNDESNTELKDVEVLKSRGRPSSPVMEKTPVITPQNFITDSDEDDVSEVESFILDQEFEDEEPILDASKFLLTSESMEAADLSLRNVDPETQARLEALLEAAGLGKLSTADGKAFADPEVLRRLTSSVSCALDEAAAALTRMRAEQQGQLVQGDGGRSLAEACSDGDIGTVRKLLDEGRSVHETTEEGESLLSLACSAGYYELAQVLLAMKANVEDRGIKGDCTPLMEAASGGYVDIVKLLIQHGGDVNAQSSSGNTALHYASCGGYEDVVKVLIEANANVEVHNENGHTPLMEAASAGHVGVARLLLEAGAGINTHSNEFKESALTLACYKGHLEMVKFLLDAGADQEHKTDEMHTALMEASMDGHVEVARLLLDSGAQVNMPADSFESPLTLAACGGHVELANLLIERGANLEEVNDEGYTPLMEAAREGHEEMVALLLAHGADINRQTEETQETALTLACCGGFLEVADFLNKAGADIELGCSTPLMEAAQEGHLELVKYLLKSGSNVHAQTGTGDTALTYACENGHTDVADVLLQNGSELEHKSEGGRTPLMKAARAGHLCTVQFLISKGANVNRQTANNDHTVLSLAAAGGHLAVVELLLAHGGDPGHKLKDGSTVLIEASKGGHTSVVSLLIDFPRCITSSPTSLSQSPDTQGNEFAEPPRVPMHGLSNVVPPQDPDQVVVPQVSSTTAPNVPATPGELNLKDFNITGRTHEQIRHNMQRSLTKSLRRWAQKESQPERQGGGSSGGGGGESGGRNPSISGDSDDEFYDYDQNYSETVQVESDAAEDFDLEDNPDLKPSERLEVFINKMMKKAELLNTTREEQILKKQQILEELQKVERELQEKAQAQLLLNAQKSENQQKLEQQIQDLQHQELERQRQIQHQQHQKLLQEKEQYQKRLQQLQQQYQQKLQQHQLQQQLQQQLQAQLQEQLRQQQMQKQQEEQQELNRQLQEQIKFQQQQLQQAQQKVGAQNLAQQQQQLKQRSPLPLHIALQNQLEAKKEASQQNEKDKYIQVVEIGVGPDIDQQNIDGETMESIENDLEAVRNAMGSSSSFSMVGGPETHQFDDVSDIEKDTKEIPLDKIPLPTEPSSFDLNTAYGATSTETQDMNRNDTVEGDQQFNLDNPIHFGDSIGGAVTVADQCVFPTQTLEENPNFPHVSCREGPIGEEQLSASLEADYEVSSSTDGYLPPFDQQQYQTQQQILNQYAEALSAYSEHMSPEDQIKAQQLLKQQLEALQQQQQVNLQNIQKKNKKLKQQQQQLLQQQQQLLHQNQQLTNEYNTINAVTSASATPVDLNTPLGSLPMTPNPSPASPQVTPPIYPLIDLDAQTESNHDTALTLACAGGHAELVNLLLSRGADIEHRDKKGFTPLILAATAGHSEIVEILLNHGADIEAQSERTKDTPLSLACSGGRYEVVELLLARGANKEHRNVSDYTPLSLAASGGYVNIIKLLLSHGAEINSRTGSKLGISPLMLAAMNGHTAAVKLLLDMGSDINAQIETNRNTALTLACFQGRHEVVSLLVDRKANIEHRAKTGLTPLMEAASGGYVEVGRVLLDKGADVNAPPVPSSRDTALTIAADKGHYRFVELLLNRGAAVDVKNKKGNSPLWLSCNGGHLDVVQLLVNARADVDSQDNRKVSCLMAAFRKGHVKVVKWLVRHVNQFPSDQECMRYIATITDKELLKKCHQCMEIIVSAKDRQAAEANKNASILLEEIDQEKSREESKKLAAQRKREKRKKKKKEKLEKEKEKEKEKEEEPTSHNSTPEPEESKPIEEIEEESKDTEMKERNERVPLPPPSATISSTIGITLSRENKNIRNTGNMDTVEDNAETTKNRNKKNRKQKERIPDSRQRQAEDGENMRIPTSLTQSRGSSSTGKSSLSSQRGRHEDTATTRKVNSGESNRKRKNLISHSSSTGIGDLDDFGDLPGNMRLSSAPTGNRKDKNYNKMGSLDSFDGDPLAAMLSGGKLTNQNHALVLTPSKNSGSSPSKKGGKREEGWKEVIRKSKKLAIPASAASMLLGRGGAKLNAIREVSGANIDIDKQKGPGGERSITIKGSADATRQAHNLITALIKDPEKDIVEILPKSSKFKLSSSTSSSISLSTITTTTVLTTTANTSSVVSNGHVVTAISQSKKSSVQIVPSKHSQSSSGLAWGGQAAILASPKRGVVNGKSMAVTSVTTSTSVAVSIPHTSISNSPGTVARKLFLGEIGGKLSALGSTKAESHVPSNTSRLPPRLANKQKQQQQQQYHHQQQQQQQQHPHQTPAVQQQQQQRVTAHLHQQQRLEHQPLPIKNNNKQPVAPVSAAAVPQSSSMTPGEYSPFNNLFGNVAEQVMLGKKDDSVAENRMNFASVAAAGVLPSTPPMCNVGAVGSAPPGHPPREREDPNLQAKAPGYKPNGQRNMSPQINPDDVLRSNLVVSLPRSVTIPTPVYPGDMGIHKGLFNPPEAGDLSRAIGGGGFRPLANSSSANTSPRAGTEPPRSMSAGPIADAFGKLRDEYFSSNQPMTLPKIESTLNPNAPNFTCRFGGHASDNMAPSHSMLHSGRGSGNFGAPGARFPQPPPPSMLNQPGGGFNAPGLMQYNEFGSGLPGGTPSMNSMGSAFGGVQPQGMGRPQGQPQFPPQRSLSGGNTPGTSPRGDMDHQTSTSEAMMNHSPSPTASDQSFPRPIGNERAHRKTPTPGVAGLPSMGDIATIWSLGNDGPTDWSPASSVLSTSVITSTVMSSGFNQQSEEQQKKMMMIGGGRLPGFSDAGTGDGQVDQAFQGFLGAGSVGFAAFTSGGLPPGVSQQLYGGGSGGGSAAPGPEEISAMWSQPLKMPIGDSTEGKRSGVWSAGTWTPPPGL